MKPNEHEKAPAGGLLQTEAAGVQIPGIVGEGPERGFRSTM